MPYKDPEKQREAKRRYYARRYAESEEFRKAEAERKAAWLEGNEERKATMRAYVRRKRKAKKKRPPEQGTG